jgi:hypothetical protein
VANIAKLFMNTVATTVDPSFFYLYKSKLALLHWPELGLPDSISDQQQAANLTRPKWL